ncbi:hypothetical protein P0D72_12810 [Paraburkholderia sediminicola]
MSAIFMFAPRPLKVFHIDGLNPLEVLAQCELIRRAIHAMR